MDSSARTLLCLNGRVIDIQRGSVTDEDKHPTTLRPQTADILRAMAANAGQIVTTEELLQVVSRSGPVSDDSLMQCVMEIRQGLGDHKHQILRTGIKRGFVLEANAVENSPPAIDKPTAAAVDNSLPAIQQPAATRRHGSWMAVAAGLTAFVASAAYFWPGYESEADRPLITAAISEKVNGDPAGEQPELSAAERSRVAASKAARSLAANLMLAQREIESLKADGMRARDAAATSLAAAQQNSDRDRQKTRMLERQLATAQQTFDGDRQKIGMLEGQLASARQSIDDLRAGTAVVEKAKVADAERRKAAEAALMRAGEDLERERSRAQLLARELDAAHRQGDMTTNDLTRASSAFREALEQERNKTASLTDELATARDQIDNLTARLARSKNAMKVAKAKSQRVSASAPSTARSARQTKAPEVSEADTRKPTRPFRLTASALPFVLLPTRRPLQEGLW